MKIASVATTTMSVVMMTTTMTMMMAILQAAFHPVGVDANVFMERPRNVSSITGRDATLRCRVAGGVMWMKENELLGLDDDRLLNAYPRYSIVGDVGKGEHHLNVKRVALEDEGWFTCVGAPSSGGGNGVAKAYLNVVVPPEDPIIEGHASGSTVTFDGSQTHLVLRCSSGFSKPASRITWRKNGVEFNPRYMDPRETRSGHRESLSNVESVLTFHPTPHDNDATVECVSTHPGSYNNRTAAVKLVVYYPPSNVDVAGISEREPLLSGTSYSLTCQSLGGNPLPTLTWRKGTSVIPDQKQIVSGTRVTSKVTFTPTPGDNGVTLTCEATSHASTSVLTPVKVTVYYPPSQVQILPQVIGRLNAQEGKELLIRCRIGSSNPPAAVSWYLAKDEANCEPEALRHFTQALDEPESRGQVSSQLRFVPRTQDHGSRVVCRADNPSVGVSVNASVPLDVTYRPRFLERRNFTVLEDSVASLSALVVANPEVLSITWLRGHQLIGPISARQPVTFLQSDMRFSGGVRSIMGDDNDLEHQPRSQRLHGGQILQEAWLNISKVYREDAGKYLCQAMNSEGRSEVEVTLDVLYPAYITGSKSTPEAVEGATSARLECSYRGNPLPGKVQWFRNGVEVVQGRGDDVVIGTTSDEGGHVGTSTLEYRSVGQVHMGVHRCKVHNGVTGEFDLSREMRLVVQHKPRIDKSSIFRKSAADINGTARLRCRAHGIPHVEFHWIKVNDTLPLGLLRHDNAPTPSDDSPVLVPSDHTYESVLEVMNVQSRDLGAYYCRAENSLGADDFQVLLGRPGPPDAPFGVQLLNATHDSITLSWRAGFDGGSRQTFKVRSQERGGGASADSMGQSEGGDEEAEAVVDNVTSPLETVVHTVKGLKLDTEYWVTVTSFNKFGASSEVNTRPLQAFTSATAPASDRKPLQIEFSILVYALTSLVIVVVIVIIIFCLVKKTRTRTFKDPSRTSNGTKGNLGNMGQSKMSSVETTTTNATLDLIGTPSLVDDLNFKTLDSLNSSNVNFVNGNGVDYTGTMTMLPKYGCSYDRVSQTHSTCDVNKCTEYRPYAEDELFTGTVRRYQNNYTPTSSILSASRTKITVNPVHLLPSCVTDANDSMISRHQSNRASDLPTGSTCYVPINSCMTSSAVLPDLHSGACGYRPGNDLYPYTALTQSRNYSPDQQHQQQQQQQHSPFQSSVASYYGLPPELRGHLV